MEHYTAACDCTKKRTDLFRVVEQIVGRQVERTERGKSGKEPEE